jgi:UDP-N-acetylmuramoyl-tripeptide--D-alanyl-D-alanine ligase
MGGLKGRGQRHRLRVEGGEALLIDESYNANPASMAATLKSLGSESGVERRIAVLGPMRELGVHANQLHAALAPSVLAANVGELVLVGDDMAPLAEALDGQVHITKVADADGAADAVARLLRPGDAVLVKASNSVGLSRVIDRLTKEIAECSTS